MGERPAVDELISRVESGARLYAGCQGQIGNRYRTAKSTRMTHFGRAATLHYFIRGLHSARDWRTPPETVVSDEIRRRRSRTELRHCERMRSRNSGECNAFDIAQYTR